MKINYEYFEIFLEIAFKEKKPYFKPTQVDKQNILKRQDNYVEGTRQIDSVTQGEGVVFMKTVTKEEEATV